jgi:hypothetical protein
MAQYMSHCIWPNKPTVLCCIVFVRYEGKFIKTELLLAESIEWKLRNLTKYSKLIAILLAHNDANIIKLDLLLVKRPV